MCGGEGGFEENPPVRQAAPGAAQDAAGGVFVQHFESGGTLLDFDAKKMRAYFSSKLEEGNGVAANLKSGETQTSGS